MTHPPSPPDPHWQATRSPKGSSLPSSELDRLKLFIYLVPIFGVVPALVSLYRRRQNTAEEKNVSRLVVVLAFSWLVAYALLGGSAQLSDGLAPRLLITSTLMTTGYFLTNLWLMVRLWQRKSIRLPGFSPLGDKLP